ncbi:Pre protein translocase subunit Sec66-domain-containing protein [Collybia nuda]|uniref:Pre protein translocase subunit Sec66-domain-containing protein n=1 Tax=Collybia nuda TaxID=64659 RepID=A0A9P6CCI1_9AGAR|nr:Pre protein translocase subunit Sec66-domain-containing protein [Collybia nuda]
MASVLVPVAYIIIVFGGLFVFSYFYRKHTSTQVYEPYFPSHPERNTYVTLLQKTDPPASDALLKSALVRRAMADVHRVMRIREDKPALQNLLQKGSIGDDLWNSLLNAEKELEAEIMEVVAEANSFVEGWGQVIFPTANEMIANEKMRAVFDHTTIIKKDLEVKYGLKTKIIQPSTSSAAHSKAMNGLVPSIAESAVSSDGEGSSTSPAKAVKKAKKRK